MIKGLRADIWLGQARFFKSRSLAAKVCTEGLIRLERDGRSGRVEKPAQPVMIGDRLLLMIGDRLVDVTIIALGERRGPAREARGLYHINSQPESTPEISPLDRDQA